MARVEAGMIMNRFFAAILALVLVAPLVGCGKTVSDTVDDADITVRVKTEFVNDLEVGKQRIDVDTFKGVVTLSGRAETKDLETKAIALARKIKGVTDVKSTLVIGPIR
jgi:osmotically-inducible protein OsmY